MTLSQVLHDTCSIFRMAYHSIGNYDKPADGFCKECLKHCNEKDYRNDGHMIDYVRQAVVEKLIRDGYKIAIGFDPVTGREIL